MTENTLTEWQSLDAQIVPGHQIASGSNPESPYPAGSIALQKPHFKRLGLDLSNMFNGTLNLNISPKAFAIQRADHHFRQVQWITGFPAEDFSFIRCQLQFQANSYSGWIYYPHPETKTQHFHGASLVEVLMPEVASLVYQDKVILLVPVGALNIT